MALYCFSGSSFATTSSALEVRVYNAQSGAVELVHSVSSRVVALESNGALLAVALQDGRVDFLDLATLEVKTTLVLGSPVRSMTFAGQALFAATSAEVVQVRLEDFSVVAQISARISRICASGSRLALASEGGKIKVVEALEAEPIKTLRGFSGGSFSQISFFSENVVAALGERSNLIFLWRLDGESSKVWKYLAAEAPISMFAVVNGGVPTISALLEDHRVAVFEVADDEAASLAPARVLGVPGARRVRQGDGLVAREVRGGFRFGATDGSKAAVAVGGAVGSAVEVGKRVAPAVAMTGAAVVASEEALTEVLTPEPRGEAGLASLAPTIRQGLRAKDKKLLETAVACPVRATMATTAKDLDATEVGEFLEFLVESVAGNPGILPVVAEWVREISRCHAALIVSQTRLRKTLEPLHALALARTRNLDGLSLLAGRLTAAIGSANAGLGATTKTARKPLVTWRDE